MYLYFLDSRADSTDTQSGSWPSFPQRFLSFLFYFFGTSRVAWADSELPIFLPQLPKSLGLQAFTITPPKVTGMGEGISVEFEAFQIIGK